jgi:hypothetical protein
MYQNEKVPEVAQKVVHEAKFLHLKGCKWPNRDSFVDTFR